MTNLFVGVFFCVTVAPLKSVELSRSNKCHIGYIVQLWFAIGFVHVAAEKELFDQDRQTIDVFEKWPMIWTQKIM